MEKYQVGDELQPYPGGGQYGICFKCKKTGMVVIAVPAEKPKAPAGWAKVPTT